jgi:hypothetical protein
MIHFYKNKRNIHNCLNYCRIEHRLRHGVTILEKQFGFMLGRSTIEVIFLDDAGQNSLGNRNKGK